MESKKQPTLAEIKKLLALEEEMKAFFEKRDKVHEKIREKYGFGEWALEGSSKEGGGWFKLQIVDNIKLLKTNGVTYRPAAFKALEVSVKQQKTKPKFVK